MAALDKASGRDSSEAVRSVDLGAFYLSAFASFVGHSMVGYTAVIYVQGRTGSELLSGLAFFCMNAPLILIGYYAGTVADRSSRKRLLLVANGLCALAAVSVAIPEVLHVDSLFVLVTILCLSCYGVSFAFVPPARFAMLGDLASGQQVERGTIVLTVLNMVGFGVGPPLVGWILDMGGWLANFSLIAGVWLLAALSLLSVRSGSPKPLRDCSTVLDLVAGLRFVFGEAVVWQLCLLSLLIVVLSFGPYQVLVPALAVDVLELGESQRGALMGAFGLGLILGGVISGLMASRSPRGLLILGSTGATAASIAAISAVNDVALVVLCLGSAGVFGGAAAALIPASMQSVTPNRFRGRVMSLHAMILGGFPAVGGLVSGVLAEALDVRAAILVAGGLGAAAVLAMAIGFPTLRRLEAADAAGSALERSSGVAR